MLLELLKKLNNEDSDKCNHDFIQIKSNISDYTRHCKKCKKYFK